MRRRFRASETNSSFPALVICLIRYSRWPAADRVGAGSWYTSVTGRRPRV